MRDSVVVDASVAAKLYFKDESTARARDALEAAGLILAPELLFIEIASVAAKLRRAGLATADQAALATRSVLDLPDETAPISTLSVAALALSVRYGVSVYDACYLALSEQRGCRLLTADTRLARRALDMNLHHLIEPLAQ
jgi:predicted nucleic acid-binding protein